MSFRFGESEFFLAQRPAMLARKPCVGHFIGGIVCERKTTMIMMNII